MFGIDLTDTSVIFDASLLTAGTFALSAGIFSFLSPCVLPIVPPYLAYMSGVSIGEIQDTAAARRKAVLTALFFILGLSTVFLILGFTASAFGAFVLQNQQWFARISGVAVTVFGLHFLSVFRIPILDREARFDAGGKGGSAMGAYVLGLALRLGGRPVSVRFLVPFYPWQQRKPPSCVARFCWAYMQWDLVFRFCWLRCSSHIQWRS